MKQTEIIKDEFVYEYRLANGLDVFIHPKPRFIQTFVSLHVNFGGRDFRYRLDNENYKLPQGTAHFLEHMLFENNGSSLSDYFLNNNADINAYTARTMTSYYFRTKNNFEDLLNRLLNNFVDYDFSEKSIKKEFKIISQELSMNDDSDETKAFKSLQRLMYKDESFNVQVGGTKTSIKEINKLVLKQATDHFYHPANMRLLISGNVNPQDVINQLENHIFTKKAWPKFKEIQREVTLEDKGRHLFRKRIKGLNTNIIEIGIKIPANVFNSPDHFLLTDPFIELAFNPSFSVYKLLKVRNFYNNNFSISPVYDDDYSFINISMQTKKVKLFEKTIIELMEAINKLKITEKIFGAYNRSQIGSYIKNLDDLKASHNLIESLIASNVDISTYFEKKKKVKLSDFEVYKDIFKKENLYIVEYLQES
ncbi:MAG: pitrilysin family protein [Candidatus Izemoplasmatales bacterium]|nr:pitrilysin family protein [Candidatus Izemoplasmatales bacterium]